MQSLRRKSVELLFLKQQQTKEIYDDTSVTLGEKSPS